MVTISTEDYIRIVERQKNALGAKKGLSTSDIAITAMSKKKKSKYLNVKKDGIDSISEGKRGQELAILQRVGNISNLRAQVHFLLIDAFIDSDGKRIQPCTYVADYVYEQDGVMVVEDVKSPVTRKIEAYRIKIKLLKLRYPEIRFIETVYGKK